MTSSLTNIDWSLLLGALGMYVLVALCSYKAGRTRGRKDAARPIIYLHGSQTNRAYFLPKNRQRL